MDGTGHSQFLTNHIASLGNGHNKDLSPEQYQMIQDLHENVKELRDELQQISMTSTITTSNETTSKDFNFCTYDTCRRYLVARKWNLKAAEEQLSSTLKWRISESTKRLSLEFWQSPKALHNPWAFNFRCIGIDKAGRPVLYTCFAEAHDRFDTPATITHIILLLESVMKLLYKRTMDGLNKTADSRQLVFLVDFDGLSLRDNNPNLGVKFVKLLMNHYPELLNTIVLINTPVIFKYSIKIIVAVLDDVTKAKILLVEGIDGIKEHLGDRFGDEIADWVVNELNDNQMKRPHAAVRGHKKYWLKPQSKEEHDPRGTDSYVNSIYYIKTPGDAQANR